MDAKTFNRMNLAPVKIDMKEGLRFLNQPTKCEVAAFNAKQRKQAKATQAAIAKLKAEGRW